MDSGTLTPNTVYLRDYGNVMEKSLPARKVYVRVEGSASDANSGVFDIQTDERVMGVRHITIVVNATGKPFVVLEQYALSGMKPEDLMPLEVVSIEMNGACVTNVVHVKERDLDAEDSKS